VGGGGVIGRNAFNTNLDARSRNLQNIKHTNDGQSAKTRVTAYREHVLPLLNHPAWKELIFNKTGNARVHKILRRLCVTIVAVEKQ
jgi:hypothetical protein